MASWLCRYNKKTGVGAPAFFTRDYIFFIKRME